MSFSTGDRVNFRWKNTQLVGHIIGPGHNSGQWTVLFDDGGAALVDAYAYDITLLTPATQRNP